MTAGADTAPALARPALKARGVFAAVLGNGFEFFDFTVYATFLGMIGQAFFPSDNVLVSDLASAATFGVGFVARPLGGALIGAYGDRAGRKPAMTLSIGLMAVGSGIIAFTPGYATIGVLAPILLIVARLFQGFAVGGEVGPATMFLLEAAPTDRRMLFASWQLASQNLSSLLGRLDRPPAGDGAVPIELERLGLAGSVRVWRLDRPGRHLLFAANWWRPSKSRRQTRGAARPRILSAVLRSNWRGVLLGLALISGGTITQYFLITMTPYAIRTLHLPAVVGDARRDHARDYRLPRGARRRRPGRSLGHTPSRDRITHRADDRLVSGDEVSGRQSKRHDARSGDCDPELLHAAGVAVIVALIPLIFPPGIRSTGLALTYAAWRCDLWRHGDLCRHLAGRRHREIR